MRIGRFVVVSLAALALGGCATDSWTKPGMTDDQWKRDRYECQREANMLPGTPVPYAPYPPYGPYGYPGYPAYDAQAQAHMAAIQAQDAARRQAMLEACLEARGYTKVKN